MKVIILALFFHPIDTIPPIQDLFLCLEEYNKQSLDAELAEYQEATKLEWLKYVPSVGLTYTINNNPRPSVSFSTSTIYQARKAKQSREAKREAIKKAHILDLSASKYNIKGLVENYENAKQGLGIAYKIHQIDTKLYQIDSAMHTNLEIAPSEWLKVQRAYLLKSYELVKKNNELEAMKSEILLLAKCN